MNIIIDALTGKYTTSQMLLIILILLIVLLFAIKGINSYIKNMNKLMAKSDQVIEVPKMQSDLKNKLDNINSVIQINASKFNPESVIQIKLDIDKISSDIDNLKTMVSQLSSDLKSVNYDIEKINMKIDNVFNSLNRDLDSLKYEIMKSLLTNIHGGKDK
jgi:seryl-tRNA synthetase